MPKKTPNRLVINGIIANDRVTYTQSRMIIEHKTNIIVYAALIVAGMMVLILSFTSHDISCVFAGLVVGGLILFLSIFQRSYRYEFDKEKAEIKCNWVGFLGTSIGKDEITCPLGAASHIRIYQVPTRYRDSFKIKLALQNGREIGLPSGYSLSKCMEYATIYKDFLEIRSPLWLPQ